jgi:hypothetical protein
MKLARVAIPWGTKPNSLARLIESADLDYLQLDFGFPGKWPSVVDSERDLDDALHAEFLSHLKFVHKWLFLRPDFAVLTNAGGSHVVSCMDALARFLVEHGSDEMPVAAIRGSNLLATIDLWLPEEIANSGRKVLSAQLEIGGGPMATALADGARIVVTGAYDRAAPLLAAAVAGGAAAWHDHDTLAALAIASGKNGSVTEWSDTGVEVGEKLVSSSDSHYADVLADVAGLKLNSTPRGTWLVSGVTGRAANSMWNLRITLEAGFRAAVLIEGPAAAAREFCEQSFPIDSFTVDEFVSRGRERPSLSRVFLHGESLRQCQQQLELLESWAAESGCRLGEPASSIQRLTESMTVRIPADQVTLSVDTRPAREWL